MSDWLEFRVKGLPAPQGSKRAFVRNGRASLVEMAGASLKAWRQDVTVAARYAMSTEGWYSVDEPVEVHIAFAMPRPKSRADDDWHATRPDIDKLTRAVLDALTTAQVWRDDSRVADLKAWKRYADDSGPGAFIAVRVIP